MIKKKANYNINGREGPKKEPTKSQYGENFPSGRKFIKKKRRALESICENLPF